MAMATATTNDEEYDRAKAVKHFDDSKIGVKGLVDSGITTIPRFFVHPPETLSDLKLSSEVRPGPDFIPSIDLAGIDSDHRRAVIVEQIRRASSTVGFFQIVNHGVPLGVLDRTMASVKGFHEQPTDIKAQFYRRGTGTGVSYLSNVDLFHSKAASWRYPKQYFSYIYFLHFFLIPNFTQADHEGVFTVFYKCEFFKRFYLS
jgi:hypothetical protein